jgi:uncharacterized membrane protein
MMITTGVGFLLLLAALAVGIFVEMRGRDINGNRSKTDRALRHLEKRFARGEIDEEEYQRRWDILTR